MNSLLEEDFIRADRNDIVMEDNLHKTSKLRKNSYRKNTYYDSP